MKQQLILNEKNTSEIKCTKCGSVLFQQVNFLRNVSPLLTQSGRAEQVALPAFQCVKCKTIVSFGTESEKKTPKSVKILRGIGDFFQKVAPIILPFLRKR